MSLYLIHISDTHYAALGEELHPSVLAGNAPGAGVFGALSVPLAHVVLANKSAGHHRVQYRARLLNLLRQLQHLGQAGSSVMVLHTGDLTQGGQLHSMSAELCDLQATCTDFLAIPGNHDLWPNHFPIFAASRTSLQFQHTRGMTGLPSRFPHQEDRTVGGNIFRLWLLNSALSDSTPNTWAVGKLEDELLPGLGANAQLSALLTPAGYAHAHLTAAALHHPVSQFGDISWKRVISQVVTDVHNLLDSRNVIQQMLQGGVSLVFCGHNHGIPSISVPDDLLLADGRLLQLPAGSATLAPSPMLSLYAIDLDPKVELTWATYNFDTLMWVEHATFAYDGTVWTISPFINRSMIPRSVFGLKPRPPFFP